MNKCCLTELAWEICGELERGTKGEKPWYTYRSTAALPQFDRQHTRLRQNLPAELGAALPAVAPPVNGCDLQRHCYSAPEDCLEAAKDYGVCRLCPPHLGY